MPIVPFEEWTVVKPGADGVSRVKLPALLLDLEFDANGFERLTLEDVQVTPDENAEPLKVRLKRR